MLFDKSDSFYGRKSMYIGIICISFRNITKKRPVIRMDYVFLIIAA